FKPAKQVCGRLARPFPLPAGAKVEFRVQFDTEYENAIFVVGLDAAGKKSLRWDEVHNYDKAWRPIPNSKHKWFSPPVFNKTRTYWIVGLHKNTRPDSQMSWTTTDDHTERFARTDNNKVKHVQFGYDDHSSGEVFHYDAAIVDVKIHPAKSQHKSNVNDT